MANDKMTAPRIAGMKRTGERIVCLTAYDFPTARLADQAGVDLILVGDSLGNVVLGYESTLPVTMDEMLHHVRAARRGASRALLVADMPFGSYHGGVDQAVMNACALIKAGAEAVKLEGGTSISPIARRLVDLGVPVMGHVGMTPQSMHKFGGYRVQGRGALADSVEADARAIDDAGGFAIVVELVPEVVGERITKAVGIPTIGIGAGRYCDGEVQVFHDLVGLSGDDVYKHTKRYAEAGTTILQGLREYRNDVRERKFPTEENSF